MGAFGPAAETVTPSASRSGIHLAAPIPHGQHFTRGSCVVHRTGGVPVVASTVQTMHECLQDTTFRVATLAALCSSLTAAAYVATQGDPAPVVALFVSFGPLVAVVLWLQQDARRTGVATVQDWGLFLLLSWPLVIPWYAFRTRGRGGWRLIVLLYSLIGAAHITGALVAYALGYNAAA
ncbi:hypothetical protein BH18ACI5_BH18ACI5_10280 [soil metagenome]